MFVFLPFTNNEERHEGVYDNQNDGERRQYYPCVNLPVFQLESVYGYHGEVLICLGCSVHVVCCESS